MLDDFDGQNSLLACFVLFCSSSWRSFKVLIGLGQIDVSESFVFFKTIRQTFVTINHHDQPKSVSQVHESQPAMPMI
ncbi:hypothetical protein MOVS_06715 [Moraxella ovis]|uniref:Uncharacterized protein n=1 Tax=Moraxella ovis TaxID=29433 RepID=A0ABN4PJB5_9GAMM|nr:hypothetical protein [Moraxella ovis]ANB91718.1 hypothetical protein MOVS_06715 [Moraxella ovis]